MSSKSKYYEGVSSFIDTALMIIEGGVPLVEGLDELILICNKYGSPFIMQELVHSNKHQLKSHARSINDLCETAHTLIEKRKHLLSEDYKMELFTVIKDFCKSVTSGIGVSTRMFGNALSKEGLVEALNMMLTRARKSSSKKKVSYTEDMYLCLYGTNFR